jgi:hypothetical protein
VLQAALTASARVLAKCRISAEGRIGENWTEAEGEFCLPVTLCWWCGVRAPGVRTLILNAIVWTAGRDVPKDSVRVKLPDRASFKPAAVEPPKKP